VDNVRHTVVRWRINRSKHPEPALPDSNQAEVAHLKKVRIFGARAVNRWRCLLSNAALADQVS
jgi:hypothetical protein